MHLENRIKDVQYPYSVWVTDDGKEFTRRADAFAHELGHRSLPNKEIYLEMEERTAIAYKIDSASDFTYLTEVLLKRHWYGKYSVPGIYFVFNHDEGDSPWYDIINCDEYMESLKKTQEEINNLTFE